MTTEQKNSYCVRDDCYSQIGHESLYCWKHSYLLEKNVDNDAAMLQRAALLQRLASWNPKYVAYMAKHKLDPKAAKTDALDANIPQDDATVRMFVVCNQHHQNYLLNIANDGMGSEVEYTCGGCGSQNYKAYTYFTGPKAYSDRCDYCGRYISCKQVDFLDPGVFNIESALPVGYALAW
jgi:hypothetical protein